MLLVSRVPLPKTSEGREALIGWHRSNKAKGVGGRVNHAALRSVKEAARLAKKVGGCHAAGQEPVDSELTSSNSP